MKNELSPVTEEAYGHYGDSEKCRYIKQSKHDSW